MEDFWIGDWVRLISNGQKGQFEGLQDGKAKIKINGKYYKCKLSDLELIPEEELEESIPILQTLNDYDNTNNGKISNVIDLHIEKLEPKMKHQKAEMILQFQIKKLKEFLDTAIDTKFYMVLVIHGKGIGTLKLEMDHILKDYDEIRFTIPVNDGGATEIYFKYMPFLYIYKM
ncbi:MAG: Smr/MutS family protein [Saprospiraceae bacterium]